AQWCRAGPVVCAHPNAPTRLADTIADAPGSGRARRLDAPLAALRQRLDQWLAHGPGPQPWTLPRQPLPAMPPPILLLLSLPLPPRAPLGAPPPRPAPAAPPQDPTRAEAAERFDRAIRLVNDGDLTSALAEFQRAYALVPAVIVLYNVGLVYAALNRPVEAARD